MHIRNIIYEIDHLGNAHWSNPADVIDKELASSLVRVANLMARGKEFTQLEVELWIKHIGPVWKGHKEHMEHALVQWYREMQEKGLTEKGDNEMEKFILHGIGPNQDR